MPILHFAQFLPSTITLNADDPAKLETIASWMTQASPRLAALPGFVDAIQPTWTAQILSNPLGTIRDTAAALGPSGRLATDATRLTQIAQRTRATAEIHTDLLSRVAGGAGRQMLLALIGASAADLQWLADEASFLETASAITNRYGEAAQAVVDNWAPPQGQPDTVRYTLLETRTALYPTPNAVKDMAATLRGVHDRLVATVSANNTLSAQFRTPSTSSAPSEGGLIPTPTGGTKVTVQPTPTNNNVWWLLGGIAVAGVGVWAITRPAAGTMVRKNPVWARHREHSVPAVWRKSFHAHIVAIIQNYQGSESWMLRLKAKRERDLLRYFWDAGADLYNRDLSPSEAAMYAIKNV